MSYILVVSNDANCRRLCVDNLVRRGYVAAGVSSAAEAENLFRTATPELVLVCCIPGGYEEVIEQLRRTYRVTGPLLLFSQEKPDRAWAGRFDVTVCLADPMDVRRLLEMLQPWLPPRGGQTVSATA